MIKQEAVSKDQVGFALVDLCYDSFTETVWGINNQKARHTGEFIRRWSLDLEVIEVSEDLRAHFEHCAASDYEDRFDKIHNPTAIAALERGLLVAGEGLLRDKPSLCEYKGYSTFFLDREGEKKPKRHIHNSSFLEDFCPLSDNEVYSLLSCHDSRTTLYRNSGRSGKTIIESPSVKPIEAICTSGDMIYVSFYNWQVETGKEHVVYMGREPTSQEDCEEMFRFKDEDQITSMCMPRENLLALISTGGNIHLFDTKSRKEVDTYHMNLGHKSDYALATNGEGVLYATATTSPVHKLRIQNI